MKNDAHEGKNLKKIKIKTCAGHRARLRERFIKSEGKALTDYEVLELFLFSLILYKDTKQIAKDLLEKFKTFEGISMADLKLLEQVDGIGAASALSLKVYGEMVIRQAKQKITATPLLNSWDAVINYCMATSSYKTTEELHLLFLNKKNYLISDEVLFSGTVDQTPFYIRDILKRALELSSSSIIIVHNHPSGDSTPSTNDIERTRDLFHAGKIMNIDLLDHFIIGKDNYTSLRNLGVLPEKN